MCGIPCVHSIYILYLQPSVNRVTTGMLQLYRLPKKKFLSFLSKKITIKQVIFYNNKLYYNMLYKTYYIKRHFGNKYKNSYFNIRLICIYVKYKIVGINK